MRDNPLRELDVISFALGLLGAVWFGDLRWMLTGLVGVMILESVGWFLAGRGIIGGRVASSVVGLTPAES